MFWLGYFLRKNMHEENLIKIIAMHRKETKKWQQEHEVELFWLSKAQEQKKCQDNPNY